MTSYMVPFGASSPAVFPLASQAKVIGALAADVIIAQMVI